MGLYARVVGIYGPVCTYCREILAYAHVSRVMWECVICCRDVWACMHVL
jgi:hypothetical protein